MASDRRVSGFGDLHFRESAHQALASASDVAQTDVASSHPEAFIVDDRRLRFSIDDQLGAGESDALRRILEALARDAVSGEASLQLASGQRLSFRAGDASSDAHRLGPAVSGAVEVEVDESETRPTIRTQAG